MLIRTGLERLEVVQRAATQTHFVLHRHLVALKDIADFRWTQSKLWSMLLRPELECANSGFDVRVGNALGTARFF